MSAITSETAADLRAASTDDLRDMGLPPNFTLDELKGFLSEAELQALQDGDDPLFADAAADPAEGADLADTGASAEGDGDGDEDDDGNNGDEDEPVVVDAVAEVADPDKQANPEQTAPPVAVFVEAVQDRADPVIAQVDTAAAKALIDAAAAERKALRAKFDDGEMSDDEFDAALEVLTDKVANAKADLRDAERTTAAQTKAYQDTWYTKTDAFMTANPAFRDTAPVPELDGQSTLQIFDTALRRVTGDPGYSSLPMAEKINTAAKLALGYYKQQTGRELIQAVAPAKTDPAAKVAAKTAPDKAVRPDPGKRPPPVRTLAGLSAASEMEADDGRFAAVDRAVGMSAEAEFARMTRAEQDAYLRGL